MRDYVIPSKQDLYFANKFTAINCMIITSVHTKNESCNLKITPEKRFLPFNGGVSGRGWVLIKGVSAHTHGLYCLQIL